MINRPGEKYSAIKVILYKGNQGGYIRLPMWLNNKTILYKLEDGIETMKKLVPSSSTLYFPKIMIGKRLIIEYNHNLEDA